MTSLSVRDRRAITLGAAVLVTAFAFAFGVRPALAALGDRRAAAEQARELLERERALVTEAPSLPTQIAARRAALAMRAAGTVRSDEPETAALMLATTVRSAARAAELRLLDVSASPTDSTPSGLTLARVAVRGESDIRGVLRFIRSVEGGTVNGRLASFSIGPSASRIAGGSSDAEAHLLMLTATIEVPVLPRAMATTATAPSAAPDPTLDAAIASTIADDPFAADRVPGPAFHIMAAPVATVAVAPRAPVRLIGTVVGESGRSFVMCAEGSGAAKLVYVGGRIGELTLRSIEQGTATFTDAAGRTVVLRVPRGGE